MTGGGGNSPIANPTMIIGLPLAPRGGARGRDNIYKKYDRVMEASRPGFGRRQAIIAQLKNEQRQPRLWICCADIAGWCGGMDETKRTWACEQLFRSLLDAEFVSDQRRPHHLDMRGFSRVLPETAEGVSWSIMAIREATEAFPSPLNTCSMYPQRCLDSSPSHKDLARGSPANGTTLARPSRANHRACPGWYSVLSRNRRCPSMAPGVAKANPDASVVPNPTDPRAKNMPPGVPMWHADWAKENPGASVKEAWAAAKRHFKGKRVVRRWIEFLQNPSGTKMTTWKKAGKSDETHLQRMRQFPNYRQLSG